ncbi:MAG: hypothetical protein WBM40_00900 [Thiohalocapsa sp.]
MLLTNLILLLALVVMVGIAIWLFRDGEGVGPTPYIRPFDSDDGTAGDAGAASGSPSSQATGSSPSSAQASAQDDSRTTVRIVSDADSKRGATGVDQTND